MNWYCCVADFLRPTLSDVHSAKLLVANSLGSSAKKRQQDVTRNEMHCIWRCSRLRPCYEHDCQLDLSKMGNVGIRHHQIMFAIVSSHFTFEHSIRTQIVHCSAVVAVAGTAWGRGGHSTRRKWCPVGRTERQLVGVSYAQRN